MRSRRFALAYNRFLFRVFAAFVLMHREFQRHHSLQKKPRPSRTALYLTSSKGDQALSLVRVEPPRSQKKVLLPSASLRTARQQNTKTKTGSTNLPAVPWRLAFFSWEQLSTVPAVCEPYIRCALAGKLKNLTVELS